MALADYGLHHPNYILLVIPLIIALIILLRLELVRFHHDAEKEKYEKHKRKRRLYTLIFEIFTIIALAIAVASPYRLEETRSSGAPSLVILSDNSSSFTLFEQGLAGRLQEKLGSNFPVAVREIASKERSALGDAILNNMQGDDHLLLITDGRNTHGRDLGDIVQLADELNTTISTLQLSPKEHDASVEIIGPPQQIEQVETEFTVAVNKVGDPKCSIVVESDGNLVTSRDRLEDFKFVKTFPEGTHKLAARLQCNDFMPQNNVFYKTIRILPKPRVLFLSKAASPLDHVLARYYTYERLQAIPASLGQYDAVIINDFPADSLKPSVSALTDYVADGNGLVVIGGKNSYDLGNYKNSLIEAMLPVQVGVAEKSEEGSLNIIIVIDISGSTGSTFGSGSSSTKIDIQKSLAIDMLKDIRANDKVGIVAFNNDAYEVSPLTPLSQKKGIVDTIAKLKFGGGTEIFKGLRKAQAMLNFVEGGKNIVVISDGLTWIPETVIGYAQLFARSGIKIHAVGVGSNTDRNFMRKLAEVGNGVYLEPTEREQLRILFDNEVAQGQDKMALTTLNRNHFITKNLLLTAKITGLNQVAPKQSARTLVTTFDGMPIVTEHRFGLGRIAAVTTDDGTLWSGQLFDKDNSILWARVINYAIGNPLRKGQFFISMEDASLGDPVKIEVKSEKFPTHDLVTFSKTGDGIYQGFFTPKEAGFYDFFGTSVAVSYPLEYRTLGMSPDLLNLVSLTGGKAFSMDDVGPIREFIIQHSVRVTKELRFLRWPFIAAAMVTFLILLIIRRLDR